jgi:hypothetical protein
MEEHAGGNLEAAIEGHLVVRDTACPHVPKLAVASDSSRYRTKPVPDADVDHEIANPQQYEVMLIPRPFRG